MPNPLHPFELFIDATGTTLAVVLMQEEPRAAGLHVVSLASRKLTAAELNYPIREKELLAVVYSVKAFRPYISHTTKV
uniref:Reverse transcriptase/retrotransposon-derived protein RNase H-like domain-containing protein n=1 Tax=Chromera velia CCMP2878 TaxID=1169474 RepID=A0A0G4HZV4_9ALVE|eukprot:Cvel_9811.t1-p1 / transcript=Cvel_9811.t1 / gene=Cvel_9811 / organism=Chromera_velia_CCMP2878 / gene_product=hypothetical protein / transcript_product=hypothetical protein / location=Cvel_scaffold576:16743-16973(-) / protein_length=77 / sequence_SO=supercontig / SO=protein_coding / is_pseudo=false